MNLTSLWEMREYARMVNTEVTESWSLDAREGERRLTSLGAGASSDFFLFSCACRTSELWIRTSPTFSKMDEISWMAKGV